LGKGYADGSCEHINELNRLHQIREICWFVKELVVFHEGFCLLHGVVCCGVIGLVG
jgi:hypothetical protein